ncbi:hypothetical protein C943_00125 [Mariniradius saccharolyticus AK6]|uniref:Uncharacterized protein n=1 Tax=Mariniradius saccharolyticus AK6 TaxID=1239962 RepID=M7Y3Q0_9BACT|nr:hypothetical protein C943_00125 [Mariniradius saccharolyticus AK6]
MICIISLGNSKNLNQGTTVDSDFELENSKGDKTFGACI